MARRGFYPDELTEILEQYRQSFNLGTEDLARLIGAAELLVATHLTGRMPASLIMSRDLVTVRPHASLAVVADLYKCHRFASLPVVSEMGVCLGAIFQMHLMSHARDDARRMHTGFGQGMKHLLSRAGDVRLRAENIMDVTVPRAVANTAIAALQPLMANGEVDAVPILEGARIVGIVRRTDLISALARNSIRQN